MPCQLTGKFLEVYPDRQTPEEDQRLQWPKYDNNYKDVDISWIVNDVKLIARTEFRRTLAVIHLQIAPFDISSSMKCFAKSTVY